MEGLGLNAIFIVHNKGFVCGNEGSIDVDSDIVKDLDGKRTGVKRIKTLKVKNIFIHGNTPDVGLPVTCLTRINIGNVFHYEGFVKYISSDGFIGINLTTKAQTNRIQEIINTIDIL